MCFDILSDDIRLVRRSQSHLQWHHDRGDASPRKEQSHVTLAACQLATSALTGYCLLQRIRRVKVLLIQTLASVATIAGSFWLVDAL